MFTILNHMGFNQVKRAMLGVVLMILDGYFVSNNGPLIKSQCSKLLAKSKKSSLLTLSFIILQSF